MLTSVPMAINRSTRLVVLRHPNSIPCTVWRKRVVRVEVDPTSGLPSEMGGAPTMGGMGVLRSEDEADYEYDELGPAKTLLCGIFQPADMNDRDNLLIAPNAQEVQVECLDPTADLPNPPQFTVDVGDLIFLEMGMGVIVTFEVVNTTGSVNIPPYVRKLVVNPRDDLHHLEPFTDL